MARIDLAHGPCPIGRASDVVADRWSIMIMRDALLGVTRFDRFKRDLGIADNILTTRLTRLVDAGLLAKVPYADGNRTRLEYRLTSAGRDLRPVLEALMIWGREHTEPTEPAPEMTVVHTVCGTRLRLGPRCPHCDREVAEDEIAWSVPWVRDEPVPLAGVTEQR